LTGTAPTSTATTILTNAAAAALRHRQVIASSIRQARERQGLSQMDLAARLGIDRRQLSEWERAVWAPNALHIERLAVALDEPVWFFYGGPGAHT
jgi:transcriptional regulator with XRE-family HTH domain